MRCDWLCPHQQRFASALCTALLCPACHACVRGWALGTHSLHECRHSTRHPLTTSPPCSAAQIDQTPWLLQVLLCLPKATQRFSCGGLLMLLLVSSLLCAGLGAVGVVWNPKAGIVAQMSWKARGLRHWYFAWRRKNKAALRHRLRRRHGPARPRLHVQHGHVPAGPCTDIGELAGEPAIAISSVPTSFFSRKSLTNTLWDVRGNISGMPLALYHEISWDHDRLSSLQTLPAAKCYIDLFMAEPWLQNVANPNNKTLGRYFADHRTEFQVRCVLCPAGLRILHLS